MAIHLLRDLEKLKKEILLLGGQVEEAVNGALVAFFDRRADLAVSVKKGDKEIDQREIKIEEECLKILALHQPVAHDLRFVIAILKVNNDLERVGDLAGNISERAEFLAGHPPIAIPDELHRMAKTVPQMLRDSLDGLLRLDIELARRVLKSDDLIDDLHRQTYTSVEERMRAQPADIQKLNQILSVSRYLERMADAATNIAEDVVFLVEGEVVRHRSW
jgi:phosphate transport system protein